MSYDPDAYKRAAVELACTAGRIVEHARWLVGGAELTSLERTRIRELIADYDRHDSATLTTLGGKR